MYIFYNDLEVKRKGFVVPYHKLDANKKYMDHYSNYIILQEILKKPRDFNEKMQATKELGICERKLDYWRKHANYEESVVRKEVEELKSLWSKKRSG